MSHSRGARARRGYTLFEVLLVLAVLLIVVGLAWSSLADIYKYQQLASAAQDVRSQLTAARAQAIESGAILQFVYEPGGRAYSVLPLEQVSEAATQQPTIDGDLPERIRFEFPGADTTLNASTAPTSDGLTIVVDNNSAAAPILFAPDGTASDSAFDILDDEGRFVRVSVRGLTAAVSVTSPSQEGER
jgi:prepilin-type N-terminal cleavage/methylation domain-containing protein